MLSAETKKAFPYEEQYVYLDMNDGSENPPVALSIHSPLPEPMRQNMVFKGWYTEPKKGIPVSDLSSVEFNATLYAHWIPGYTYWFFLQWDGSAAWISGTVAEKKPFEAFKRACRKAGFDLTYSSADWIDTILGRGTVHHDDCTYSTYWLTFFTNVKNKGLEWIFSPKTINSIKDCRYFAFIYGDVDLYNFTDPFKLSLRNTPDLPYLPGFLFKGYYYDKEFTEPFDISSLPTEDVRLYVKWEKAPLFQIRFDAGPGSKSPPVQQPLTSNTIFIIPTYLGRNPGHRFVGWVDHTGTFYKVSDYYRVGTQDVFFEAVWKEI